jgi:DNA ligase-1
MTNATAKVKVTVFDTLFKKTSTGAIQQWTVNVVDNTIFTEYGQVGGAIQRTEDTIKEGKNLGRSNETNAREQAEAEALAQWTKKLKRGYVKTKYEAENGLVDEAIQGGVEPMLAHTFEKQAHKIKYPCYGQIKLDGTRCIAIVEDGVCTLWSRTRKPITSMPHIIKALESAFPDTDVTLDGELYAHHLNSSFEEIIHFVRQESAAEGHEAIQYWVYDVVMPNTPFAEREAFLTDIFPKSPHIVRVPSTMINNPAAVDAFHAECVSGGFEGCMLRNVMGLYVNKRSYDLIKVKSFLDGEFEIIGCSEGRGKLAGAVGAFVCKTDKGVEFEAKLMGSLDRLKRYWVERESIVGKVLTVKFQGWTADGSLRFPVGVEVRDYE